MSPIRHRSVHGRTEIAVPVKEDHVDASRAVHVAQPAAGMPTDRELPARPDACCGEVAGLPADRGPTVAIGAATVIATVHQAPHRSGPAHLAPRPGPVDGIQAGRAPASRPRRHQDPLTFARDERQPVLRITVQDDEVPARLPQHV